MQRSLFRIIGILCGLALPVAAHAAYNIDVGLVDPCVAGDFACESNLAGLFTSTILTAASRAFRGVLLASLIFYGLRLLFTAQSDNAATETKQAYEYAIVAAILVVGAEMLSNAFGTPGTIAPAEVRGVFTTYALPFIEGLIVAALIANITIQGFRMIVAGDEGALTKARKHFLFGMIGVAIVLLASPIVNTVWGSPNISTGMQELVGIGDFLITIFGALAVVGVIVSGIMLVISIDEGLKDKARKLLLGCIVALIVVISAAALLHLFIITKT